MKSLDYPYWQILASTTLITNFSESENVKKKKKITIWKEDHDGVDLGLEPELENAMTFPGGSHWISTYCILYFGNSRLESMTSSRKGRVGISLNGK